MNNTKKGFGKPTRPRLVQTFYCECLWHDDQTDEEELVELWRISIDRDRFPDASQRKAIAFGLIYSFLDTQEAKDRSINRVFIWNGKTGAYEPLGVVSDNPLEGSEKLEIAEVDPEKAYRKLLSLCEIQVTPMSERSVA